MHSRYNYLGALIALVVVLAAGLLLYLPGINGPFLFDDYHNFLRNTFVHMTELNSHGVLDAVFSGGGHFPGRGLARLSFALNFYFSEGVFSARSVKLTNILIHLLNAIVVFALARALLIEHAKRHQHLVSPVRVMWVAVLSASVWLVHPMQLTSVLYAVQRMTSLSALFVFLGLLGYLYGRRCVQRGENRGFVLMALSIGAGSVLGFLSKENAALLPFLAYLVHLAFFPATALEARMRRRLQIFHVLFVGTALVLAIGASVWSWSDFIAAYESNREFTMAERVLTQPRALFLYLSLFMFPSLRRLSLHHDDFVVSSSLFSPMSTIVAVVLLVLLVGLAIYRLRSGAMWAFAALFFVVAHAMESTFLPLEMVYEHRNYLPSFALALLFAHALTQFSSVTSRPVALAAVVGVAVILGACVVTWARAGIWSNEAWLMQYMSEQHPNSYRAQALAARARAAESGAVSGIFAAYARVARAKSTAIFPLIRMRRIANAMQYQLREGLMEPASPPGGGVLVNDGWDVPMLYLDVQHLNAVAAALSAEIKRRLPLSPIHHETLAELSEVGKCIEGQLDLCIGLDDEFLQWMQVALAESKMDTDARIRILENIAAQHERNGDFDAAHAALRRASELNPSAGLSRLRITALLVRQGRLDEAESLLQQIEGSVGYTRVVRDGIRNTREFLDAVRNGENSMQRAPMPDVRTKRSDS